MIRALITDCIGLVSIFGTGWGAWVILHGFGF